MCCFIVLLSDSAFAHALRILLDLVWSNRRTLVLFGFGGMHWSSLCGTSLEAGVLIHEDRLVHYVPTALFGTKTPEQWEAQILAQAKLLGAMAPIVAEQVGRPALVGLGWPLDTGLRCAQLEDGLVPFIVFDLLACLFVRCFAF